AQIGPGCLVAGGAVVLEGTVLPEGSLVAGVPAKVRRALTPEEREGILRNARTYLERSEQHSGAIHHGDDSRQEPAGTSSR
ncbi:hypothetical protein ACO1LZ_14640, partial [Staphylococcus aureus]